MLNLSGKLALVTGSSAGIGLALADALAGAGAEIVLNGRDSGKLASVEIELRGKGYVVHPVAFDVTDRDSVNSAIAAIETAIGPIRSLVNNAGMQYRAPLEEVP